MTKKIDYKIIDSTETHKERSWGSCQENDNSDSAYYNVTKPITKLLVGNVVIATDKPMGNNDDHKDYSRKRLEIVAKDLLSEKSIKAYYRENLRIANNIKTNFNKAINAHKKEAKLREKFALDRIRNLRKGSIKTWESFEWKTVDVIDNLYKALEGKK